MHYNSAVLDTKYFVILQKHFIIRFSVLQINVSAGLATHTHTGVSEDGRARRRRHLSVNELPPLVEPPASLISVTSNSHRLVKEGAARLGSAGKSKPLRAQQGCTSLRQAPGLGSSFNETVSIAYGIDRLVAG
jgi:hypothetical protein